MTADRELLEVAREWKAGELGRLHPQIARLLNMTLHHAGEDPVPHARSTDSHRPNLAALIRKEHGRASGGQNGSTPDMTRTLRTRSERKRAGSAK